MDLKLFYFISYISQKLLKIFPFLHVHEYVISNFLDNVFIAKNEHHSFVHSESTAI